MLLRPVGVHPPGLTRDQGGLLEPAACRIQPQAGCRWQGGEAELALTQLSSGMEGSVCQRAPSTSHPPTPNAVRLHRPAQISQRETSHICLQSRCVLMHPGCILSPFPRSFHKKKIKNNLAHCKTQVGQAQERLSQNPRCPEMALPAAMETEVHQLRSSYISPSKKDKKIASTSI